jgi:hypothetical protein
MVHWKTGFVERNRVSACYGVLRRWNKLDVDVDGGAANGNETLCSTVRIMERVRRQMGDVLKLLSSQQTVCPELMDTLAGLSTMQNDA